VLSLTRNIDRSIQAEVRAGLMPAHGLLEFQARKQLQKLAEDAAETLPG